MKIFGHRGSAGNRPENTLVSFQEAARAGADGIELDVQLSKDGVPVILHDERVNRTTNGEGWVKDLTFAELRALDAGGWFAEEFRGEKIPSLDEVLEWLVSTDLVVNIELKTGVFRYEGIEERVLDLVKKHKLEERVILSSFNHYSLVEARRLHPTIETAILFMEGLYEPWNYAKTVGAQGLHCYLPVAVPELLQGAAEANMPVRPFTVNDEAVMEKLIRGGAAGFFTDHPERAVAVRRNLT